MLNFLKNTIIMQDMQEIEKFEADWSWLYNKTIFISGAYGMLASYFVYFLIYMNEKNPAAGIKILAQGRNVAKMKARFGKYVNKAYFKAYTMDICQLIECNEDVDYIIHAASLASPQYYEKYPIEVALPNIIGTKNLLDLAVSKNTKSFLFFSSGDVYGKMPAGIGAISEEMMGCMDPLDMHSCYGESKRMGENLCVSYTREKGIKTNMVRIGHTYSPTMDINNDPRVFASLMKNVVENKDIVLLSDGTAKRPFCYITDAIKAFLLILHKGLSGEAYNMCNDQEFLSIAEFANILAAVRSDCKLNVIKKTRSAKDSYLENNDNKCNLPSSDKLRKLGWQPQVTTLDGVTRVYKYLNEIYI